jgi:CBS domain containing-hemolysin-like protein
LRAASRWFLFFTVLFAPVSAVLWALGRLLERLFGQSPARIRLALARKELGDVFEEGRHAGILHPTQSQLAQNFFLVATRPVSQSMTPRPRVQVVPRTATRFEALKKARRLKLPEIAVAHESSGELAGYVRTVELIVDDSSASLSRYLNPLAEIPAGEMHGEAIMHLQASGELMARVVDNEGHTLGVVTLDALTSPLLVGSLSALHRLSTTTDFPVDIQAT